MNIILIGMPGCGKSSIGEVLAERINYKFIDVDKRIVEEEKKEIADIFKNGEDVFRDIETKILKNIFKENDINKIVSTGGGVIKRKINIDIMSKNGLIIFINRPLENIVKDIDTESRPLLAKDKEKIYQLYKERFNIYKECCDIEILNDGEIEETINKLVREMKM